MRCIMCVSIFLFLVSCVEEIVMDPKEERLINVECLLEGGPEQYAGLLEALSFPVRKCAHITEYAVFYLTVLYGMGQWEQKRKPWLIKSFAVTFFYACTDEFHQLFVPGRAGRLTDVLIDCIGVSLITAVLWFRFKRMEGSYGVNGTNL